jgi:hypothetical protein
MAQCLISQAQEQLYLFFLFLGTNYAKYSGYVQFCYIEILEGKYNMMEH